MDNKTKYKQAFIDALSIDGSILEKNLEYNESFNISRIK